MLDTMLLDLYFCMHVCVMCQCLLLQMYSVILVKNYVFYPYIKQCVEQSLRLEYVSSLPQIYSIGEQADFTPI